MRASITNYFLLNLAIADATISIFNVSFAFTFNLYYKWFFGRLYCTLNNFLGVTPISASVFTLMVMSLDRYGAIVHPLRGRSSRTKTIIVIVCIWVASGITAIPMVLYSRTPEYYFIDGSLHMACLADAYPDGDAHTSLYFTLYNYFLLTVHYILPLGVLSFTYVRMGMELWGSQKIGDHRHEESVRAKKKVVKMMVAVVSIFMCCWLPYHAYFTVLSKFFIELDPKTTQHLYLNMYFLAMSSTIFNPIIYVWMNSRFRIGFKYAFRWLPCVRMSREEYMESDLHRDRFHTHSNPCRRRSTATTYYKSTNGNISPSSASEPNRRTISVCTQLSHHDDEADRCDQQIALLEARRHSMNLQQGKKRRKGNNEDVAI